MTSSPRGADDLVDGQAIPEATVNENMRHVEAGACHFPVADRTNAPPGSCADGDSFIITATATGAWTGKETQIATALGANAANGWRYHVPIEGFTAYVQDENQRYLFDGASWAVDTTGGSYTDEQARDAVGAALANGDGITVTVNDGADTITITNTRPRVATIYVTDPNGSALTTGDGKAYFRVPAALNGCNLTGVAGAVTTSSSSGIPTVQVANVTDAVDMLSTKLTIDQGETDSSTAAAAAVIDTAHDDVATGDMLRIDIDVAGTGAKGLIVQLTFEKP